MNDLRFAYRQLAKSPGFVAVAILTLALGIGANTAIFSVIDALLLRPLPYPESDRIVQVWEAPNTGGVTISSGGVFMDWQDHTTQLETIAAAHQADKNLTGEGEPVRITGLEVSADYLRVLRVNPVLGRGFAPADDAPGGGRHVVIITYELWQSRFQGNPGMVGRTLRFDGESYTVIGVLPPNALVATNVGFLTPATIRAEARKQSRDYNYICFVIGRLKPGATMRQAEEELNVAKRALNSSYPKFKIPWTVTLQTLQEALFGNTRPYVLTLLAAVGVVLLIACANVANLLLVRTEARSADSAIRMALGASRAQLLRQALTETMLLAFFGGALGIAVAAVGLRFLIRIAPADIPRLDEVRLDGGVLWFALALTTLTGLIFGLAPAWRTASNDPQNALKSRGRTLAGAGSRLRTALIIAESGLSAALLILAGLLLTSFSRLIRVEKGFSAPTVLAAEITIPKAKYQQAEQQNDFVERVVARLNASPGVVPAAFTSALPLKGEIWIDSVWLPGDARPVFERPSTNAASSAPTTSAPWGSRSWPAAASA